MRIIRVYPIMLSDTSTCKGLNTLMFSGLANQSHSRTQWMQSPSKRQTSAANIEYQCRGITGLKTCIMICNDLMWFNSAMQRKKYKAEERALLMLQTQVTTQWRHNSGQWLGHRWLRKPDNNCDTALTWSNILSDDLVPCVVIIHSQLWDTESLPPARRQSHNQGTNHCRHNTTSF